MSASPVDAVEAALDELHAIRPAWAAMAPEGRAALLEACIQATRNVAAEWVARVCQAKGIDPDSQLAGEAWLSGPMTTVRTLRVMAESLRRGGRRAVPVRERGGQYVATVTPLSKLEGVSMGGLRAEVWLEPGAEPTQGAHYGRADDPRRDGGVALVLGAGNISAIAAKDIVHKLVVDNQVVILKMHPVTSYLTDVLEQAFGPLIDAGFLAICEGDAEVGEFLCGHDLVDSLHLTGSDQTYDAIVWGADPEERERRKAAGTPVNSKPFTAELGCVSPILVVPGAWKPRELDHQARSVAGMVTHNASFNCTAGKVLVTAASWPQREEFLARVRQELAATPPRRAYYPGAAARYGAFRDAYPDAEALGETALDSVPWTLLPEVPARGSEYALLNEAFCGVLADVPLAAADAGDFLARAVEFVNQEVWGSLSCNVLIDPRTERALGPALEDAITGLRYGGVAVNTWSSVLFGIGTTSWGAFPGNSPENVQSGIGWVGNALLFDHPQKSVAYGSFTQWPIPPWFGGHRSLRTLGRRWTELEAAPSWAALVPFALAAIRG